MTKIILGLLFLNLICLLLLTYSTHHETFSILFSPPAPQPKYTYDDMLSIETLRTTETSSRVVYMAVDDQNYKLFAVLSQSAPIKYPSHVMMLANIFEIDLNTNSLFYGTVSELKNVLLPNTIPSIELVPYLTGKTPSIVYALYPYAHIKTFSLKMLAPKKYMENDSFIDLITIPMAWVDGLDSLGNKQPLHSYPSEVQQFYAMLVPFAKPPQSLEYFKDKQISVRITKPLESVKVLKMIRDVHTRLSVHVLEVSQHLGNLKLEVSDQLILLNQKHRSINGLYYIVARNESVLILENTKSTGDMQPGDRIYDPIRELAGVLDQNGTPVYYNDAVIRAKKESCISNPNIQTRTMCDSEYDLFGNPKPALDVWDRPCEFDNDCPFFNTSTFKGGCKFGICEMPLGAKQVGFRKYVVEDPAHLDLWTLSAFENTKEGFTQEEMIYEPVFHPGKRQYVYFPNQPNAPIQDSELLKYLEKIKGKPVQSLPLQSLLEISGLYDQNYYIPLHRKLSSTKWQCVLYKFETVEGHSIEFEVIDNMFGDVRILGRVPEQVIH